VSFGSHSPNLSLAFSPAGTSNHSIRFLPSNAFWTAASKMRTLARQMSGPVPSPSMKGMIGSSGTIRRPPLRVIAVPAVGALSVLNVGMVLVCLGQLPSFQVSRSDDLHRNCGKGCGNHRGFVRRPRSNRGFDLFAPS
jgi:hypothetical protein